MIVTLTARPGNEVYYSTAYEPVLVPGSGTQRVAIWSPDTNAYVLFGPTDDLSLPDETNARFCITGYTYTFETGTDARFFVTQSDLFWSLNSEPATDVVGAPDNVASVGSPSGYEGLANQSGYVVMSCGNAPATVWFGLPDRVDTDGNGFVLTPGLIYRFRTTSAAYAFVATGIGAQFVWYIET